MNVFHSTSQALQWLRQHVTGTLHTDSRMVATGSLFCRTAVLCWLYCCRMV